MISRHIIPTSEFPLKKSVLRVVVIGHFARLGVRVYEMLNFLRTIK